MEKPITLVVDEVETNIVEVINNSNLPAFMIRPIIERILISIKQAERNQLNADKLAYEKATKREEENG